MSFRPRYSLLTLLVLTALVAGGVKLWYGPHRVSIGAAPTTNEQAILDEGHPFEFPRAEVRYEYDYLRTWHEQRILSVACFPTSTAVYLVGSTKPIPDYPPGFKQLYSESYYQQVLKEGNITTADPKERVVCWIHSGRKPVYRDVPGVPAPTSNSPGLRTRREIVSGEELLKSYFVTAERKVYEVGSAYVHVFGIETPLDQIADPDVRTRIAEELHKLPEAL